MIRQAASKAIHLLLLLGFASNASIVIAQPPGTFTATGNMTTARAQHTATLLADGRVLLAGGAQGPQDLATAELYDPSIGTFTATGDMTMARVLHTATLLADGRVLILGGDSAELYDPSTGTFSATGNMTEPHRCSTAILLTNGRVLIVDNPSPYGSSARAELYDPDNGNFSPTGTYASIEIAQLDRALFPSSGGWDCPRATLLADGRVLIAGGAFAELYDPAAGTFSITGTQITLSNGFVKTVPQGWLDPSRATLLLNGLVLFDGGDNDLGAAFGTWLYDPSSEIFSATGNMATPRVDDTATLLPDGTVLVAGGPGGPTLLQGGAPSDTELYDPATGIFLAAAVMTTSRFAHTATLLSNGKVLITGGLSGGYPSSSAELYTPAVLRPAPALFSLSGDGRGQGAIWHAETRQIASSQNPAGSGEILAMYTTSLGNGSVIPPHVAVGGRLGEILYFSGAPGYPGYNQVNFRVPSGVAPGSAVPVRLTYLGRSSNEVTIGVQ